MNQSKRLLFGLFLHSQLGTMVRFEVFTVTSMQMAVLWVVGNDGGS
jgi:hypothetical protein